MEYSKYIDHTLLKAFANEVEIINLCEEAKKYNFKSVCVNPYYVKTASKLSFLGEQVDNSTLKANWVIALGWSHAMYILVLEKLFHN